MNEEGKFRSSSRLAKGIGGLTMVLGAALVVMAFFPLKQFFSGEKEWVDYVSALMIVSLMGASGALVILGGYQFLREVNLPNLKVLVGVYSAIGALWISARVSDWYPEVWHQRIASGFFILGTAVAGILIYLMALRVLMPAMGMNWNGCRRVLGKGAFGLLAWFLWQALFAVAHEVDNVAGVSGFGTMLLVLLGPISMAWGFYILAVNWLKAGQQVPTNPPS